MKKLLYKTLTKIFNTKISIVPSSSKLKEKVIVITGGSKGLGKACAEVLLAQGATVVVIARSFRYEENSAQNKDNKLIFIEADLSDTFNIELAINTVIKKIGKIDVLINNAGIFLDRSLESTSVEDFEKIMNVNIKGAFLTSKVVIPYMKKQKSGFIINIGSKISHNTKVEPNKVLYATTKYALEGFSFALNRELKRYGIRVTCLMPGTINTFFSRKSKSFMSPYEVGKIISSLISFEEIDFESLVFKSIHQDI